MKIYKFPLQLVDFQTLYLPKDAKTLSVQAQYDVPTIWVLVDPEAETEARKFWVIGTGHPTPENINDLKFLGTVQQGGGTLIWHVFEEIHS